MFKKLKQKIEEGGEGGLERVSFSEKLPGSIVRTGANNGPVRVSSPLSLSTESNEDISPVQDLTSSREERGSQLSGSLHPSQNYSQQSLSYSQPSSDSENVISEESRSWDSREPLMDRVPRHLVSQPVHTYQSQLECKVQDLEKECARLKVELSDMATGHASQVASHQQQVAEVDRQLTEVKMQLLEAELERVSLQNEHEAETKQLKSRLEALGDQLSQEQLSAQGTMESLRLQLQERDVVVMELENVASDLREKIGHLESQLAAYENQSENVVVSRLHSEVVDVERRVQSRNVEIQILERRLAAQGKEKDEQAGILISRLEEVEKQLKTNEEVVKSERMSCRNLQKELQEEVHCSKSLEEQLQQLKLQLQQNHLAQLQLQEKIEKQETEHVRQLQDLEVNLSDKDTHISSLLKQIRNLQGNRLPMQPVPHPPGAAHRTMSVGVQTSSEIVSTSNNSVLQLCQMQPVTALGEGSALADTREGNDNTTIEDGPTNINVDPLSAGVEMLRSREKDLEEELTEKIKIMKIQQQTILDLKKELRAHQKLRQVPVVREKSHSPSPPIRVAIASDVNFQYLKHVVIRFMCSHTDEALQLTKAIATLLEFSPQEEQHVKNYLNYKMSWFGALPPPLFSPAPST